MPNVRESNVQFQIDRLQQKHSELEARIEAIDTSRLHLTAAEQFRVRSLKKQKLAAKDQLHSLGTLEDS